jgi:predicted PurR-regulated permease PerM
VNRKRSIKRAKNKERNNGNVEKAKKDSSIVVGTTTKTLPSGHVTTLALFILRFVFYLFKCKKDIVATFDMRLRN